MAAELRKPCRRWRDRTGGRSLEQRPHSIVAAVSSPALARKLLCSDDLLHSDALLYSDDLLHSVLDAPRSSPSRLDWSTEGKGDSGRERGAWRDPPRSGVRRTGFLEPPKSGTTLPRSTTSISGAPKVPVPAAGAAVPKAIPSGTDL